LDDDDDDSQDEDDDGVEGMDADDNDNSYKSGSNSDQVTVLSYLRLNQSLPGSLVNMLFKVPID